MTDESQKSKMGFAGLSDLVSDLGEEVIEDENDGVDIEEAGVSSDNSSRVNVDEGDAVGSKSSAGLSPPVGKTSSHGDGDGAAGKWMIGIVAVAFLIGLINLTDEKPSQSSYSPPEESQTTSGADSSRSVPSVNPNEGQRNSSRQSGSTPRYAEGATGTKSGGEEYTQPPVGENQLLSIQQIRWCIREQIRLQAMRDVMSTKVGVDKYNNLIDDFNGRCSSYRYREGALTLAQYEVERERAQIVEGALHDAERLDERERTSSVPQVSSSGSTNISTGKPSAVVTREVQQLLSRLGYEPGPVDGSYGPKTSAAVKAYQRDAGLNPDGDINPTLLFLLRSEQ